MTPPPRLLVLTDRSQLPPGRSLRSTMLACAEAGLTHVVLREPDLEDAQRARLAAELVEAGLAVIAARRPVAGASALHLADGASPPRGAPVVPWGRSCHRPDDVLAAAAEGASWVTLSPYAWTASKPGHGPPLPPEAFAGHPVPVYALGGILPGRAAAARGAGAHGVAVMGPVMRAADPGALVGDLLREVAP